MNWMEWLALLGLGGLVIKEIYEKNKEKIDKFKSKYSYEQTENPPWKRI